MLIRYTVDYDPSIKSQLASTHFFSGPYAVQIWSRDTPESGRNETFVVHRVACEAALVPGFLPLFLDICPYFLGSALVSGVLPLFLGRVRQANYRVYPGLTANSLTSTRCQRLVFKARRLLYHSTLGRES